MKRSKQKKESLFTPAFIKGFFKIFYLRSTVNTYTVQFKSPADDADAIRKDWERVGKTLKGAIDTYGSTVAQPD